MTKSLTTHNAILEWKCVCQRGSQDGNQMQIYTCSHAQVDVLNETLALTKQIRTWKPRIIKVNILGYFQINLSELITKVPAYLSFANHCKICNTFLTIKLCNQIFIIIIIFLYCTRQVWTFFAFSQHNLEVYLEQLVHNGECPPALRVFYSYPTGDKDLHNKKKHNIIFIQI